MRRLITAAAALLLTLTACVPDEEWISNSLPHDHWYVSLGLSVGDIIEPLDDTDMDEMLQDAWQDQEDQMRSEFARRLAEDISMGLPDKIDISVSMISIPGFANGKPSISEYNAGGFMSILLSALHQFDLDYVLQGSTLAASETYFIPRDDEDDLEVNVQVLEFYLLLRVPVTTRGYPMYVPSTEPKWDPPSMREKRLDGFQGW